MFFNQLRIYIFAIMLIAYPYSISYAFDDLSQDLEQEDIFLEDTTEDEQEVNYELEDIKADISYELEDSNNNFENTDEEQSSPDTLEEENLDFILDDNSSTTIPSKEDTKATSNSTKDNIISQSKNLLDNITNKVSTSPLTAKISKQQTIEDKYSHLDLLTKIKSDIPTTIYDVERWVENNPNINQCFENGRTILLYLVENTSNTEGIAYLIERGADLYTHCMPQYEALFVALEHNVNPAVIETLILNETNLLHIDEYGNTALIIAATKNPNPDMIHLLVQYGLDINQKNDNGFDALTLAAYNNNKISVIEALIDNMADVNATDKMGHTPLMAAAISGNDDVMRYLIKRGANVSAEDKNGLTVLDYYNKRQYLETLGYKENPFDDISEHLKNRFAFIIENHFSLNEIMRNSPKQENPLQHINLALNNLVEVDIVADNGCTTLLNACLNNNDLGVIKTLVEQDADINALCKNNQNALMFIATHSSDETAIEKANYLINNAININHQDDNGDTALNIALQNKANILFIDALLNKGINTNLTNKFGETAIWVAINNKQPIKTIKLLLKKGANGNQTNAKGDTPLWHFIRHDPTLENIEATLQGNTVVDFPDKDGNTPLMHALKYNYPAEIIKLLLQNGADPKMKNYDGQNAYDIIKSKRYFKEAVKKTTSDFVKKNWD